MDELITCSMNCQKKALYACDCTNIKVFFCTKHAGPHGILNGNHHFTQIMKNPDPRTKKIIVNLLKDIIAKSKKDRIKIIQESSLLIKQIKEETAKSFENLLNIEKRADEYLHLCETLEEINSLNSKSFIESLLNFSTEDAAKIKFQDEVAEIDNDFKEDIKDLFIVQEAKSLFNADNFWVFNQKYIKYFSYGDLFAVDVASQNSKSQNICENTVWDPTCLLDDGSIFCCFKEKTFIITPNNSKIALDSSQYSDRSGLIAVEDFVYMFGGIGMLHWNFH